jgi:O-methyltransferase domain/Dimerisation domain
MSEDLPEAPEPTGMTPDLIMQLGTSFMVTRHLIAAAEVGVFEALGEEVLDLDALAARIAIPRRTTRICADAMVALGLLERDGPLYRNSPVADAFLSGRGRGDLRPFLLYLDVSYRAWAEFTGAIRAGQGSGFITRLDPEAQRVFSTGVESATAGSAVALAESYEFGQHRRLLDLGGGTGSFLVRILSRHPAIECGLFELPHVVALARENLKAQTSGSRVRFYEGDLLRDQLPKGYDAFLLANVVHVFTPEHNRDLLERVHASAPTGARLLLVDFWTNPTHTQPIFAALMAGEWLMGRGEGDVYSEDEIRDLLTATGWMMIGRRPLTGPASLVVAERQ